MKIRTSGDQNSTLVETADRTQIEVWEWEGGSVALGAARSAEVSTFLPSLLTRDYELMDEAARRLLEGTCCLLDEDKLSAFELFSKLKSALMDHIQFEEGAVFKSLNLNVPGIKGFIYAMKAEHRELTVLINEALRELQESRGTAFRVILREFLGSFRRHRKLEAPFWYKEEARSWSDENLKRMRNRLGSAAL